MESIMKIAIAGTGYVGLVTGTCFSDLGIDVTCVDINEKKIEELRRGMIPIYEPGLEAMVHKNVQGGRLHFATRLSEVVNSVSVIFSAVGTPPGEDGSADLRYVLEVAREVGRTMNDYKLLVTKSTVPVGTAAKVRAAIREELDRRGLDIEFDVASNPEFLKEGDAIKDFSKPNRIVIGVESDRARALMDKLYRPFTLNGHPIIYMDIASAEMTKYAANAMLATRISFMNDIANLCELTGADIGMVRRGIGADERIGSKFLYAGAGYGGSCFPKDVQALVRSGLEYGHRLRVLEAVEAVNDDQKKVVFNKLSKYFRGDLKGRTIAVWGLSFKPNTDDMRVAPSLTVIPLLLQAGCRVNVTDPVAMDEARGILGNDVHYMKDIYDTVPDADAVLLLTEWQDFRIPHWAEIKRRMKTPLVIDGRNIYDKELLRGEGFEILSIGAK
jgi:UDPglucose 6-dehydrogenase